MAKPQPIEQTPTSGPLHRIQDGRVFELEDARTWELYVAHTKHAWDNINSSADSFDQSLLTISSGALGVSLVFLKDIAPLKNVQWIPVLLASWIAFATCICITVLSFLTSISRHIEQLPEIFKYYYGQQTTRSESAKRKAKEVPPDRKLLLSTKIAAGAFTLGIICTLIFTIANVEKTYMKNSDNGASEIITSEDSGSRSMTMDSPRIRVDLTPVPTEQRARPIAPLAAVPLEKSRPTTQPTKVPVTTTTPSTSTSTTQTPAQTRQDKK